MNKQNEYLMTLAALALVEEEGYKIIDVRILGKEIWLNNPQNTKELIRFSLNGSFNLPRQEERTEAIRKAIEKIFGERTFMYDVRFDEEESLVELSEDTAKIILSPKTTENIFLDRFPRLKPVLAKTEDNPSDLEEAQKRLNLQRPQRAETARLKTPKATFAILILCVAFFGIITLIAEFGGYGAINTAILFGAYYKTFIIANYEYWRFLTSGFIHIDPIHLLMNMYALYNLGIFFENKFGIKRFILTLLVGIVSGSMFLFITTGNVLAVGLSGGLFALLGAIVVFQVESGQIKYRPVQIQLFQLFVINLFISFLPGIAFMAHIGGFISGVLVALYFSYKPSWKPLKKHVLIASVALVAIMISLISIDEKHAPYYVKTDQDVLQEAYNFGFTWYAQTLKDNLEAYYARENR